MTQQRLTYASASKWLHWTTAACILFIIPAGLIMDRMPEGPLQDRIYDLHRSFGALVLTLTAIRFTVRRWLGVPAPEASLTKFERIASVAVHHMLYVLLFVTPLIGWAMVSAYGAQVPVFGLFFLPPILAENKAVYDFLSPIHHALAYTMGTLVLVHAGAALQHHFIKHDNVLRRMWPSKN